MVMTPNERIKNFENKQKIIYSLILFAFLGIAIVANKLHIEVVAEQSTKFISRMIQTEDFRIASMTLQEARLDKFKSIRYISERQGRSFVLPPNDDIKGKKSFFDRISTEEVVFHAHNPLEGKQDDKIVFKYDRFNLFPFAFGIWILLIVVSYPQTRFMKKQILKKLEDDLIANQSLLKAEIANQVRHNLRTPIAALMRIPSRLPDSVKEDRELLINSISQINSITAALESSKRITTVQDSTDLFQTLKRTIQEVELTIPESIQFKYELDDSIFSAKVLHVPFEFQALLGNIVNNAVDAIRSQKGHISIICKDLGPEVQITIQDSGHGMSSEVIQKIFEKGFSKKTSGSGIGLFHAQHWINAWKGRIQVKSQNGVGSTFTISLPVNDRPRWHLSRLKLDKHDKILIIDDQPVARELWRLRLQEEGLLDQSIILSNISELTRITDKIIRENVHCFFDYDLEAKRNGIDLLKNFSNAKTRCLVTGHFDKYSIREECENLRFYLLPKSQISELPIVILNS